MQVSSRSHSIKFYSSLRFSWWIVRERDRFLPSLSVWIFMCQQGTTFWISDKLDLCSVIINFVILQTTVLCVHGLCTKGRCLGIVDGASLPILPMTNWLMLIFVCNAICVYKFIMYSTFVLVLLNQACACLQPAHTWFLRIVSVHKCLYACLHVCVCVCLPLRLLITSGMMWHDIDPMWLVKKFYGFYMAVVVDIISGHDISIHTRRGK